MVTRRIIHKISLNGVTLCPLRYSSSSKSPKDFNDLNEPSEQDIQEKLNLKEAKDKFWEYHQKDKGKVYSLKPIKVKCNSGKIYLWCSCGYSRNQPFCDGTHRVEHYDIKLKPIPFECNETKDYWFCNCKQTNHRPFCDGTHRELKIDDVKPTIRH